MLQLLWNMFKETGQVNTYMFYKALEHDDNMDEYDADAPGILSGAAAAGLYSPLEDQA